MGEYVTRVPDLKAKLANLETKLQKKLVRTSLRKVAKVLASAIKTLCPTLSGALKRSIKVRAGSRSVHKISINVEIGGPGQINPDTQQETGSYVRLVEYVDDPFIRPGFDQSKYDIVAMLIDEIRAGINEAMSR